MLTDEVLTTLIIRYTSAHFISAQCIDIVHVIPRVYDIEPI